MNSAFRNLGTSGLAAYLAVWFIIAPILVVCTCADGHVAYTVQGHAEPACGHPDENHGSPTTPSDSDKPHDHEDEQLPVGEWVTSNSSVCSFVIATVCVGFVEFSEADPAILYALISGNRAHGPPGITVATLSSTVLLI